MTINFVPNKSKQGTHDVSADGTHDRQHYSPAPAEGEDLKWVR